MNQMSFGQMDTVEIKRLCAAGKRIYKHMDNGKWYTLKEIAQAANTSEAGASARLRDFRKPAFGSHTVDRRKRGENLWEYQLTPAALIMQFRLGLVG